MEISSPTIIVERAGSYAWIHKSSKVREEFSRTVTSAICLFASTELPLQRSILPPILQMLNDFNHGVREAAMSCIEEMYTHGGSQFKGELQRYHLPASMEKEINARLERIEPRVYSPGVKGSFPDVDMKLISLSPKRSSPRARSFRKERSVSGAGAAITDKQIEPITVYSENELIRETEKIISNLVPENDWSVRIAAMQRVECLVLGGASDYTCFRGVLKQLTGPLITQLYDRRSSIVKQACHLLCFLSKELLGDFETFAEMCIPVLLKLVVIAVLVIAESADNCIKTILQNCNVARVLPHIVDCAKTDRSAVLRASCCEYALLILEKWTSSPQILQSADLYEDLIRCCVMDAMSEVRSTARMCYRLFSKTWPKRSQILLSSFNSNVQRIINEEDRDFHRRYFSSSLHDRTSQMPFNHVLPQPTLPGYGTSAIVAMDRSTSLPSGVSVSSGLLLSQTKSLCKGAEDTLEKVLHGSKQKISAIETMLGGLEVSDKQNRSVLRSSSLNLASAGVDPPSSRDPPFSPAVPSYVHITTSLKNDSTINSSSHQNCGLTMSDIFSQVQVSRESAPLANCSNGASSTKSLSKFSAFSTKGGSGRLLGSGSSIEENNEIRESRRFTSMFSGNQNFDNHYQEANLNDFQSNYVTNFQRPLPRKPEAGRLSTSRRRSFDDSSLSFDASSHVNCPASLSEKLSKGLSPSSDWAARVSAFNYLQYLLRQGPKGVQEVLQYFDKVMRLFFRHLDDPHHKIAHAALSSLADIITSCQKPYESYMDRMLPHVFSRLVDPKELVRQTCSRTLETLSKSYTVDSLLPALLRSLDEQRSPKAKLAVIEFAIASFNSYEAIEGFGNSGILKLWLAKLTPLAHDKNTRLKEAAISCIISVYSHYDSFTVLNFILSLSIEEQSSLRRALKHHTPRIEVDLINFLQSKKERQRPRAGYDSSDAAMSSEEGYIGRTTKSQLYGRYSTGSAESDSGKKWSSDQVSSIPTGGIDATQYNWYHDSTRLTTGDLIDTTSQNLGLESGSIETIDDMKLEGLPSVSMETNDVIGSIHGASGRFGHNEVSVDTNLCPEETFDLKVNDVPDGGPNIPQILHSIVDGDDEPASSNRRTGLQQLLEISEANDVSIWLKHFDQVRSMALGVLDHADPSIRELALSLILGMLKNQKELVEESLEIVIQKMFHVAKENVAKVADGAEECLMYVVSHYEPLRCLSVIVPFLVNKDGKTLVTCIKCLTKLVGRLSQGELVAQLPSFLPVIFEAFGNPTADVRKTVVFCLVEIYMMLGKAFLPHLEGLNSTQQRLVTIYANRISQARTDTDTRSDQLEVSLCG